MLVKEYRELFLQILYQNKNQKHCSEWKNLQLYQNSNKKWKSNQLSGNDIHIGKTIIKDSMSSLSILNYNQNELFSKNDIQTKNQGTVLLYYKINIRGLPYHIWPQFMCHTKHILLLDKNGKVILSFGYQSIVAQNNIDIKSLLTNVL